MREIWYHGASTDDILTGFQIIENIRHRTDPGDLGLGIYFSLDPSMSLNYGDRLYQCSIEMDRVARIPNPYRLWDHPQMDFPSRLFRWLAFDPSGGPEDQEVSMRRDRRNARKVRKHRADREPAIYLPGRMKTVHHSYSWNQRYQTAQRIRYYFLKYGFTGIAMEAQGGELVVFDPSIIKDKTLIKVSDASYDQIRESDDNNFPIYRNNPETCQECGGLGRIIIVDTINKSTKCIWCHGAGTKCESCLNKKSCGACRGTGKWSQGPCGFCGGDGQCPKCRNGAPTCKDCKGSGINEKICLYCHGSGERPTMDEIKISLRQKAEAGLVNVRTNMEKYDLEDLTIDLWTQKRERPEYASSPWSDPQHHQNILEQYDAVPEMYQNLLLAEGIPLTEALIKSQDYLEQTLKDYGWPNVFQGFNVQQGDQPIGQIVENIVLGYFIYYGLVPDTKKILMWYVITSKGRKGPLNENFDAMTQKIFDQARYGMDSLDAWSDLLKSMDLTGDGGDGHYYVLNLIRKTAYKEILGRDVEDYRFSW